MSDLVFSVGVDTAEAVEGINTYFAAVKDGAKDAGKILKMAMQEADAEMQVEIKFKNGEVVAQQVKKFSDETTKVKKAQNAINGEIGKTVQKVKDQLNVVKQLLNTTKKYEKGTKKLTQDWQTLNARAKQLQNTLTSLTSSNNFFENIANTIGRMGAQMLAANLASKAITATFAAMGAAMNAAFSTGIEMEQLSLQLKGFTGSAEAADQAMSDFIKIAVQTPMNLQQVAKAGKTLMGFGIEADKAKEATRKLAIVAGATGGDLNNLARNFGQIGTQGRAYTRDLQQFAIQGIPIWTELAKVVGKTTDEVKQMASDGTIGLQEVEQALSNMTDTGSAFDTIAREMQQTWQGQIEAMVSSLQVFSGELVKGATKLDNAFGAPVQNSIKTISKIFLTLADNMDTVITVVGTLTAAFTAFSVVLGIGMLTNYINGLGGLGAAFIALKAKIMATSIAQSTFLALTGPAGILALAAGLAAAGAAYVAITGHINKTADGVGDLNTQLKYLEERFLSGGPSKYGGAILGLEKNIKDLTKRKEELIKKQQMYASFGIKNKAVNDELAEVTRKLAKAQEDYKRILDQSGMDKQVKDAENLHLANGRLIAQQAELLQVQQDAADAKKRELDAEKTKLNELLEAYKRKTDRQKEDAQEYINAVQNQITQEKDALRSLLDDYKKAHNTKMDQIRTEYDAKMNAIDDEIAALGGLTASEKKLRNIRKQKIQQKLRSRQLTYEERLELQAQLERMTNQDRIAALRLKKTRLTKEKTSELTAEEDKYKRKVDEAKNKVGERVEQLEGLVNQQKEFITQIEKAQRKFSRGIEDATEQAATVGRTASQLADALNNQLTVVSNLQSEYNTIDTEMKNTERRMEEIKKDAVTTATKLAAALSSAQGLEGLGYGKSKVGSDAPSLKSTSARGEGRAGFANNFSGGPMRKGETSYVNELGKEAFLTASGKLSMINASAFGKWTAPESGTVIPAHLTKQLNIPAGGIDLNKSTTAGLATSSANSKGFGSIVKAINASAGGGGVTTNNVTVQAVNPTQTASDMMVTLNRARRNRYT